MSNLKPITLYSHAAGPNPWKVAILLRELNVPYKNVLIDFSKIKEEPYISVNPNGRVPAIEDPNTGYTIWESGAILHYLVDEYDKDHKVSFSDRKLQYEANQWLFFQVSGQGPHYGELAWFSFFHANKESLDPSVVERYRKEALRVIGVIDSQLSKSNSEYLVGNKCSYADLSFIPWSQVLDRLQIDYTEGGTKNSTYKAWMDRMMQRQGVKQAMEEKAAVASH